jgi:tellurite resistance protein TerC
MLHSLLHSLAPTSAPVSGLAWALTCVGLALFLTFDFFIAYKDRHKETTLKKATIWVLIYVALAITFGVSLGIWATEQARTEFFAGWITEYSLSFDNLFIFILILARMKVAKEKEELILLIGIVSSLFLRGIFIAAGSAIVNRFEAIFFLFGAFLIYTAFQLFRESDEEEWHEGRAIAALRKRGVSVFVLALSAIALTNVLFAFDSIPAIFGLTRNTYVIVTANIFALMGLRQLYFLIGGLMTRLVYLTEGLSIILAFIGVKLIFEAAIATGHPHVLGIAVPEISLEVSLGVILGTLGITALLSLVKSRRILP